jgi:uncharacterized protein (TIGR03000 family)
MKLQPLFAATLMILATATLAPAQHGGGGGHGGGAGHGNVGGWHGGPGWRGGPYGWHGAYPYGYRGYGYWGYPGWYGVGLGVGVGVGAAYWGYGYPYYGYPYPAYGYPVYVNPGYGGAAPPVGAAPAGPPPDGAPAAGGPNAPPPPQVLNESNVLFSVRVPADAQVWINETITSQTGPRREFVSSGLLPGKTYTFTIRAQWTGPDGKPTAQERRVTVQGGERRAIDFTGPN